MTVTLASTSSDQIETRPRQAPDIAERYVDGEIVLYDPQRQTVHVLNATAAFVWERCDGTRTVTDLAAELAAVYHDRRDDIALDVRTVVNDFCSVGLVTPQ